MEALERFIKTMDYGNPDRVPNYEVGVWAETVERWKSEGLDTNRLNWEFLTGEAYFNMDPRQNFPLNDGMLPAFEKVVLETNDRFQIIRNELGITVKELLDGISMDQYISFPVTKPDDFQEMKKRYIAAATSRYPAMWEQILVPELSSRTVPLWIGSHGFYWRMREWMGTEELSMAFYDQPCLIDDMCEFIADFNIELFEPVLDKIAPEFIWISEDMAMKGAPLLGPDTYRRFIYPHMRRLVDFYRSKGVRYIAVDSDGDPELLIPILLEAGVDTIWPLERAAGVDPVKWRRKFGRELRMWGGIDKRVLTLDKEAIGKHLLELAPLVEEGGFIPSVDHMVPPDVSLDNFCYYMECKRQLLGLNKNKLQEGAGLNDC